MANNMSENILYLFPDTNLFIQCKSLKQIGWSEWSEYREVHLVVCRPVTREIESRKPEVTDGLLKELALPTSYLGL